MRARPLNPSAPQSTAVQTGGVSRRGVFAPTSPASSITVTDSKHTCVRSGGTLDIKTSGAVLWSSDQVTDHNASGLVEPDASFGSSPSSFLIPPFSPSIRCHSC